MEREWGGNSEKKKRGQTLRYITVSLVRTGGSTREGRDICIRTADSLCCTADTKTAL